MGRPTGSEKVHKTHPPRNQHQKGPICLWVAREVTESWQRAKQAALFPLGSLPHMSTTMQPRGSPHCDKYLRLHPLLYNRCTKTKRKKKAQMKEQIKAPEKIQLSDGTIANLSEAEFKILVIRKLIELVEYGHNLRKK